MENVVKTVVPSTKEAVVDNSFKKDLQPGFFGDNAKKAQGTDFNIEVNYNDDLTELVATIYTKLKEKLKLTLKETYVEWGISILSETGYEEESIASISLVCDLEKIKAKTAKTTLLKYNIAYQQIKNGKVVKFVTNDFPLNIKITQGNAVQDSAKLALNLNEINVPYLDLYFATPEAFGLQSKVYYRPMPGNPALPGSFCVKVNGNYVPIVSQRILADVKKIFQMAYDAAEGGSPTSPWGWVFPDSTITLDSLDASFQRQLIACKAKYDSVGSSLVFDLQFLTSVETIYGGALTEATSTLPFTIKVTYAS